MSAVPATGGLEIAASEGQEITVEFCTDLAAGGRSVVGTYTVPAGDRYTFTDADWASSVARFYRVVLR